MIAPQGLEIEGSYCENTMIRPLRGIATKGTIPQFFRPDQLLTIAGYARMDRTALSKIFYLALLAVIATTNLKLMDNYL